MASCLTSALHDDSLLDVYQKIEISWPKTNRKPVTLDYKFMYKPDPLIHSIHPPATINR